MFDRFHKKMLQSLLNISLKKFGGKKRHGAIRKKKKKRKEKKKEKNKERKKKNENKDSP